MATFEIEGPNGSFEIEAPDQASAVAAFQKFSAAPKAAEPSTWDKVKGTAADVGQALPTGILKGAIGLAGLPGLAAQGVGKVVDMATDAMGLPIPDAVRSNGPAVSVSPERLTKDFEAATGKLYEPTTTAGKFAQTVGEFVPGAGRSIANQARFALTPGVASEAAGQATEGTVYEPYARAAGAVAGAVGGALVPRRLPVSPSPVAEAADEAGVALTAGQRTQNPALLSREDMMLGGAMGERTQQAAQRAREIQEAQVRGARDAIGERVGTMPDEAILRLDRPADAGGIVGQRVGEVARQAEAGIAARNAALQADRDALFRGAESASEAMGARFNPQGFAPVDAGAAVGGATRQAADRAKSGYQQAYRETFSREGEIAPEFFTGVNKPGSQSIMAPGAAVNEFAAPVSTRVKERLLGLDDPIIPDATITPLASRTLDELDRVAALRLGRIGNPVPGQEVAGVNLRGIEQARKIITSRINAAKANPQAAEDLRALRGIARSFDDELERGFDSALFKGDSSVLDAMKGARGEFARYQQTFRQRARGDDAGATIQKIVERNATPEEVSNYILGASRVGDNGLSVRLYDRLGEVLGPNAEAFNQIKGAAWQKLTAGADAATPEGARKLASAIQEFTAGRGSTLAKKMFSADELRDMQRYGSALNQFATMAKSPVAKVEAEGAIKTLIDVANKRLSPEDMAASLFGFGNKVSTSHIRLVDAVGSLVGKDGPEWAALRQGYWQRLTGVAEGKSEMGAQKMSQRLFEALNGEGKTLAERLYSPQELSEMRRFAAIQAARIPKPGTTNPSGSGNRMGALAEKSAASIGVMIGAHLGGPAGAGGGLVLGGAVRAARDMLGAREAARLFSGREPTPLFNAARDPAFGGALAVGSSQALQQ